MNKYRTKKKYQKASVCPAGALNYRGSDVPGGSHDLRVFKKRPMMCLPCL